METIFGRRRPDSIAVEWSNKVIYILEFKRTSDQRQDYRERREARARAQHDILVKSLEKVAGEAVGENSGWKIILVVFVGGTCGSRFYAHTLRKDRTRKVRDGAGTVRLKKFFKGWTILNET